MIAKLGFVLLFIAFGVLAFLMGVFAPDDARGKLPGLEQMLQGSAETGVSAPAGLAARALAPVTRPGDKAQPLENLLLPTTPSKARYTLQLGIFPNQSEADALTAQVEALHMPGIKAKTLAVRDRAGQSWWIAAAGDQDEPEALESARVWLSERLALNTTRAIQLPAEPK
ncbi:MAG: SPOR domain-containing protein [Gallionellaceae bacterium]|nr:SPOR domain-containing protein [Gallionellaceae bacterium]